MTGNENNNGDILRLRESVYGSYEALVKTGSQSKVAFPEYREQGEEVFMTDEIEDDEFDGNTYLAGKVVSREDIGAGYTGVVIETEPWGIEMFEHFTGRGLRPLLFLPGEKGLVANITVLRKNLSELEDRSPESVIGINFSAFPNLMAAKKRMPDEEYQEHYLRMFGKLPLFF